MGPGFESQRDHYKPLNRVAFLFKSNQISRFPRLLAGFTICQQNKLNQNKTSFAPTIAPTKKYHFLCRRKSLQPLN